MQTINGFLHFAPCFIVLDWICHYEIRGYHGGNCVDAVFGDVMPCSLVIWVPSVLRKLPLLSWVQKLLSFALKLAISHLCETAVCFYETTGNQISEDILFKMFLDIILM
jgi:hypothetical protein